MNKPGKPQLSEADILFELFIPLLCATRGKALEHFKHKIQFHQRSTPPRSWYLTGGKGPWIQRGDAPGGADVTVTVSEDLVSQLVRGQEPDLVRAGREGRLQIDGPIKILESLELTLDDAKGIAGVMSKR